MAHSDLPAHGATLVMLGDLRSDRVMPWILHRARRLDLRGWAVRHGSDRIDITVHGPGPLIDAMEVACSLGPGDVLVDRIIRGPAPGGEVPPERFALRMG